MEKFDVVIVGAGPAGSSAAHALASRGYQVLILERGKSPGTKNVFGGRIYPYSLAELIPNYQDDAPIERFITKEEITLMTDNSSFSTTFSSENNTVNRSFTTFRSKFDKWLSEKAVEKGALLFNDVKVDDVVINNGTITGIITGGDEIKADLVVGADGATSTLGKKTGLVTSDPENFSVGVKEVIELPESKIEERFSVDATHGAAAVYAGHVTRYLRGGAFIYTNRSSLSIGVVVRGVDLIESKTEVHGLLNHFKDHHSVKNMIKDGRVLEYSGHLIPEIGYADMPKLFTNGFLLAGDSAGFLINNGYTFRGVDMAISSGIAVAETYERARKSNDFSSAMLSSYIENLERRNVLSDLKTFRSGPGFLRNPRLYSEYPKMVCDIMEKIYTVDGKKRKKIRQIVKGSIKDKVSTVRLLRDLLAGANAI